MCEPKRRAERSAEFIPPRPRHHAGRTQVRAPIGGSDTRAANGAARNSAVNGRQKAQKEPGGVWKPCSCINVEWELNSIVNLGQCQDFMLQRETH